MITLVVTEFLLQPGRNGIDGLPCLFIQAWMPPTGPERLEEIGENLTPGITGRGMEVEVGEEAAGNFVEQVLCADLAGQSR